MLAGQFRVGTSGWIHKHWRGVFSPRDLPDGHWFGYYVQFFDTVEINFTFYRLPAENVFDDWQRQAPPGFVYAVKASRFLTHMKKLKDPEEPLERILGRSRRLGAQLGPVLYQLPPRWRCNLERLRQVVSLLPRDLHHVLEFREPTWYTDAVREVLTEAGVGFCIHDMRGAPCPLWATGPVVYVRFHGPTEKAYAGCYPRSHLERWAELIERFRQEGHDVFAYFNNVHAGNAVRNARELQELLHVTLPAAASV